jgi:anti-sigma-K factor RskA
MRLLRPDLHTLTGAYALDAVDDAERDRFEHHLHRCESCRHEVSGLRETAARLAMAVARQPPAGLRERVLTAAAQTRQLPPVTDERPLPQPHARRMSRPARRRPRLAVALAAAGMAVVIALGITLAVTRRQLDNARAQQQAVAAVLNSPDARILTRRTSLGGSATVVVSRSEQKVIFTAAGLPPPPGTRVYQLWLIGPLRTRSAGLLPLPSRGRVAPLLASGLARGDSVGVTVEPAGGSAQPTTTPIVVIPAEA